MQYLIDGGGCNRNNTHEFNETAPYSSMAPPNPRATIAIENNVIYSPCIATEVGGKEEKQANSDIETSIQSYMCNKHDKFHNVCTNVYTRLFRLVHKLSRSHILLL